MKPTERDLLDKALTAALGATDAEAIGALALGAEINAKSEEHAECKLVLERTAAALRDRERDLRKQNLGGRRSRRHA
jgi:hypothetical protein